MSVSVRMLLEIECSSDELRYLNEGYRQTLGRCEKNQKNQEGILKYPEIGKSSKPLEHLDLCGQGNKVVTGEKAIPLGERLPSRYWAVRWRTTALPTCSLARREPK